MIREIVTDEWVHNWKLKKKLAEWASSWGASEVKTPTGAEICNALFKHPPLEWSRITPFQDRTMVLMCQRLLPEARRNIYLQGTSGFKVPRRHVAIKVYCSPHNAGSRELAEEMNAVWPGLLDVVRIAAWDELAECDHMLIYLNALTWTHEPESLAADIEEAQRMGLHLQSCHEFPSSLDPPGSTRAAIEFKSIIDATPRHLKTAQNNIYSQIAIAIKGGELRDVGLSNLAERLARIKRSQMLGRRTSSGYRSSFRSSKLKLRTSSTRPRRLLVRLVNSSSKRLSLFVAPDGDESFTYNAAAAGADRDLDGTLSFEPQTFFDKAGAMLRNTSSLTLS
eukprot:2606701-Prymnesium_polylepis.1